MTGDDFVLQGSTLYYRADLCTTKYYYKARLCTKRATLYCTEQLLSTRSDFALKARFCMAGNVHFLLVYAVARPHHTTSRPSLRASISYSMMQFLNKTLY